jgi:hypothetical protein
MGATRPGPVPALIVTFDTNLYRKLSSERFTALAAAERRLSIRPLASYYVATEFLAHLADRQDPSFGPSLGGLTRLWEHTHTYDGAAYVTHVLEPAERQVAYVLFPEFRKHLPPSESLGGFIGRVVHTAPADLPGAFHQDLVGFRDFVREKEESFVASLFDRIVRILVPDATSWHDVTSNTTLRTGLLKAIREGKGRRHGAEGFVRRVVETFDYQCSEETIVERVAAMQEIFPVPLHVVDRLVVSIIERGLDMTRKSRANSLWDIHISFSIGTRATFDTAPLWLITDDAAILDAAKGAGSQSVKSLNEYSRILESDWHSFRSLVG